MLNVFILPIVNDAVIVALSTENSDEFASFLLKFSKKNLVYGISTILGLDVEFNFSRTERNQIFNAQLSEQQDSIELFMTAHDGQEHSLRMIKFDTSLSTASTRSVPTYQYLYAPGKYVWPDFVCQGVSSGSSIILGPYFDNDYFKTVGLIRSSIDSGSYQKVLIIPDTVNLSYAWKTSPLLGGDAKKNGNFFVTSHDMRDPRFLYFSAAENHIYVGKAELILTVGIGLNTSGIRIAITFLTRC